MNMGASINANGSRLTVDQWQAGSSDELLDGLRKQLLIAQALWPELKDYQIVKRSNTNTRKAGGAGGRARAEVLSPERREEIARTAANARWNNNGDEK